MTLKTVSPKHLTDKIFTKDTDIVVMDKHLVRLSTPPSNTRPGKLIKLNTTDKSLLSNNYRETKHMT